MVQDLKGPAPFVWCPELNSVQYFGKKMPINCDQIGHWSNRMTFKNIIQRIYENLMKQRFPLAANMRRLSSQLGQKGNCRSVSVPGPTPRPPQGIWPFTEAASGRATGSW